MFQSRMLGIKVALKQASPEKATSAPSLYREIRYLRQAGPHPNIIQLFGAFLENDQVCLVMEIAKHVRSSPRANPPCTL